jgi:hypothetical protein
LMKKILETPVYKWFSMSKKSEDDIEKPVFVDFSKK